MVTKKFRSFNVRDDCYREAIYIQIDNFRSSKRIIRTQECTIEQPGEYKTIITENGLKFTSKDFELLCKKDSIENQYIQAGKPLQKGYSEIQQALF